MSIYGPGSNRRRGLGPQASTDAGKRAGTITSNTNVTARIGMACILAIPALLILGMCAQTWRM